MTDSFYSVYACILVYLSNCLNFMGNNKKNIQFIPSRHLVIGAISAVALLSSLIGYSYFWNTNNIEQESLNLALSEAQTNWNKDAAFRQWATGHGGVYVEPTERTPRSAALAHLPERDIVTTDGRELTLMNPAYMLRQMTDEFEDTYGIKGSITGKLLLNPINAPDAWQLQILNRFEAGDFNETYEQQDIDGQPYLRYMKAMYMTEGCVRCHGVLGFKDGDLRGGVSVSIPLTPYFTAAEITSQGFFITHLVVWAIGLAAIATITLLTRGAAVQIDNSIGALRTSEGKFRGIIASAPDGMVVVNGSGVIEIVNKELERLTGYQSKELIGEKVELVIPKRFTEHEKKLANFVEHPSHRRLQRESELFCLTKDGREIPVDISLAPIETEDGTLFTATIRDISETLRAKEDSARLKEQLTQSQKMEAVGQLAGGIAHDFNNVLQSVLGYSDIAKDRAIENNDAELEAMLSKIISSGDRARELVEELLVFSQTDKLKANKLVSVNDLLQITVVLLQGSMPSSIEIKVDAGKNLPLILVNPTHLEQMLLNIAINAMHAMDEIGTLSFSTRKLSVSKNQSDIPSAMASEDFERIDQCFCEGMAVPTSHAGDYVEISIGDQGSGIPKEDLPRIFEPFYRTKEVGQGTGMGLSMVHGIMKGVGGHIVVESEAGKGTLFRLLFQAGEAAKVAETSALADQENFAPVAGKCVLLVDDDAMVLDFMRQALSRQNYAVEVCTDGEQALAILEKNPEKFDLVITDQTMPKMTGINLSKKIMEMQPTLPVVLCSGYDQLIDEAQVDANGIKVYLKKPVPLAVLVQTVNKLFHT